MLGIVIVADNASEANHEHALHDGADYFLHKPVKDSVLLATIRSFLRRLHIRHAPLNGPPEAWSLYRRHGTLVSPHNERLALSDKECAVLTTLFLSPHFPVSSEQLLHALNITAEIFDPHRIDTIIYRIRKKLGQLVHARFEIRNIYGRGFMCVGMKEGAAFYVWDG
ncbi:MAG TPA: winged helix-turn-helix domain-containing protein [Sphingomonadaceae bacterium]|uniref:response regulator transcription factor n=1 Tax=Herbaspirillum sp. TaxID=1890675 RepID=UPI002D4A9B56|nr:winged helix-turn-helix domain-containing protein [Herbaspirillum sp.]HZF46645.1 winged helix-turn-helix domain-containing protein [Sphingomonadaceae bacterium]HZG20056.1 winged helix-turn-helix domain-containing protein [Herbaspirillum sp.]